MAWIKYNANPTGKQVGDCAVRAVSKATNQLWEDAYSALAIEGLVMSDMPSANRVWGAYLKHNGFKRHMLNDDCPDCYTVDDFCRDHPNGTYILALHGHVIAAQNGNFFDSWDSGGEAILYYFEREE